MKSILLLVDPGIGNYTLDMEKTYGAGMNCIKNPQPRATAADARKVAIVKKLVNEWVIGPTQGHKVDLGHRKGA